MLFTKCAFRLIYFLCQKLNEGKKQTNKRTMKRESKEDLNVNQNYCLLCSLEIGLRSSKIPTVIETHTFFLLPVPTFA